MAPYGMPGWQKIRHTLPPWSLFNNTALKGLSAHLFMIFILPSSIAKTC